MEFKEMASVMTDAEVKRCMTILIENSVVLDIHRNATSNEISVDYRVIGDDRKTYSIILLPDGVQDIESPAQLRTDGEYLYEQYLVAKGYSIYWNVQICEYVFETMKTGKRAFDCFAGKYGGFINYNGDVGACEVLNAYGNLSEYNYNFMALWEKFLGNNCKNTLCDLCTHETEGIIPSMYLGNNK